MTPTTIITIGGDVSKGRMDVAIINQAQTLLDGSGSYDDTRRDHDRLGERIRLLRERHPDAEIRIGVEATGGYERNWLATLRGHAKRDGGIHCWRLNPLALKRWLDADLHRQVDDRQAALGIARYLLERRQRIVDVEPTPQQAHYRLIREAIATHARSSQQLQMLLQQVQPELVHACRSGIPQWILAVLRDYPTAAKLARAHRSKLAALPHVGAERADELIAAAKTTIASLTGSAAEDATALLVDQMDAQQRLIERHQQRLVDATADDPRVTLLESIPGIGRWTAIALTLEIGDVARFATDRQLIAWAGLDPHDHVSGDQVVRHGISKRGNSHIRALLYMPILSAVVSNPTIKVFYNRLLGRGKTRKQALTACMAKMLRIVYAILVTGRPFAADYEAQRSERKNHATAVDPSPTAPATAVMPADHRAPVTRREARRRAQAEQRQAAAPATKKTGSEAQAGSGATA